MSAATAPDRCAPSPDPYTPQTSHPSPPQRPRAHRRWWHLALGLPALILALSAATGIIADPLNWALHAAEAVLVAPATASPTPAPSAGSPSARLGAPVAPASPSAPAGCTGQNATGLRRPVDVGPDQNLCGGVTVVGAGVSIEGSVAGNVTVAGGSATIAGRVGGSVTVLGGNVYLLAGADVGGGVTDAGGTIRRDAQSHVGGSVQEGLGLNNLAPLEAIAPGGAYAFPWAHIIFWALAGAALALFYPSQIARVRRVAVREFPSSVVVGALAWVIGALLAVVLFITCLGIPVALALGVGLWVASVVGTVALGYWVGDRLLGAGGRERSTPLAPTVLGVSLIALAKAIPCVGAALTVIVACAGLGATLLTWREGRHSGWRG